MKEKIEERVRKVICDELCLSDESRIVGSATFAELGADELDRLEVLMAVEEEFGFEIDPAGHDGIDTFGQLVECVKRSIKE